MFYWVVKAILTPILRVFFRPWVEGGDHIPVEGPAILARGGRKSTGFSGLTSRFAHAPYALYRRRRFALHRSEVSSRAAGAELISWLQNSRRFLGAPALSGAT